MTKHSTHGVPLLLLAQVADMIRSIFLATTVARMMLTSDIEVLGDARSPKMRSNCAIASSRSRSGACVRT